MADMEKTRLDACEAFARAVFDETLRRASEPEKLTDEALASLAAAQLAAMNITGICRAWREMGQKDGGR